MKRLIIAGLLLLSVCVAGTARAGVNFNELDADTRGSGTLRIGRQAEQIDRVYVHFKRYGDVEIVLYGERTHRINGRWFGGGDNSVEIDIQRAFDDSRASGKGEAWFGARNKFERLELSGRASGNNFSLSFREGGSSGGGNRPGGGGNAPFEELSATSNGNGLFRVGDDENDIRSMSVELRRDNSAFVEMRTNRETHRLTGRWSPHSSNTVTLTITRGFDNKFTSGYGSLTFGSRNRFEGVELNGVTDNRRYSIDFRASGTGGSGGFGGSDGWGGSGAPTGNTSQPASGSFEGGIRSVNSTVDGRGYVNVDLKRSNLRRIDVDLRPGGSASIRVSGERNFTMRGTWDHQRGSQGIRILLESGFEDNQQINGQGFIVLDKNRRVSKLDLSGKVGGKNFKILFTPS